MRAHINNVSHKLDAVIHYFISWKQQYCRNVQASVYEVYGSDFMTDSSMVRKWCNCLKNDKQISMMKIQWSADYDNGQFSEKNRHSANVNLWTCRDQPLTLKEAEI